MDKKHLTRLKEVCSNANSDFFSIFESKVKLYRPFEIIVEGDIDWKNGKIISPNLGFFAGIAPVSQFAKKLKTEGKVLYGRNILSEITIKTSFSDKIKSIFCAIDSFFSRIVYLDLCA